MKKVVYMGTPDFAVPALEALIASPDYDVKLIVSQPDKPQGRKQVLTPPPVKEVALRNNIETYQPATLKTQEAYEKIAAYEPDFIVVAAYGKILPENILNIPRFGCINLHGSLLPKYRGAAPIQWSVINGDKKTGVTTILMAKGLDTGDMLMQEEKIIGENETAGEVFDALADMCPALLMKTLKALENGEITPVKQNEDEASYVSVLSKEMSYIDWTADAQTVHNLIRGMNPWPVARTRYNGKILKIYESLLTDKNSSLEAGSVIAENGRIFVVCGNSTVLELKLIQLEGSKRMSSADFLCGHTFGSGFSFITEE